MENFAAKLELLEKDTKKWIHESKETKKWYREWQILKRNMNSKKQKTIGYLENWQIHC